MTAVSHVPDAETLLSDLVEAHVMLDLVPFRQPRIQCIWPPETGKEPIMAENEGMELENKDLEQVSGGVMWATW